jgi:hypothetical protein
LVPDHRFESCDEVGRLSEESISGAVVDHDEVSVVAVQRDVVAVFDIDVGVVPDHQVEH